YYSLVAVFNPLHRPQNGRTELTAPVGTASELSALASRDREMASLKQQTNALGAAEVERRIQTLIKTTPDLPQAYIWREPSPTPPVTHVLLRGSPAHPGDVVEPGVPAILVKGQPEFPAASEQTSRRRLGLAEWLVNPDNPLTARVIVNRVWQHHFGV